MCAICLRHTKPHADDNDDGGVAAGTDDEVTLGAFKKRKQINQKKIIFQVKKKLYNKRTINYFVRA